MLGMALTRPGQLEHPAERCPGLGRHQHFAEYDQHRILRRAERYQFIGRRQLALQLHGDHQVRTLCLNREPWTRMLTHNFFATSCLIWRRTSMIQLLLSSVVNMLTTATTGLKGPPLPPRRWSLGRYGLVINIVSLAFILPLLFFAFWPVATPVTT